MAGRIAYRTLVALLLATVACAGCFGDPRYSVYLVNQRTESVLVFIERHDGGDAPREYLVPAGAEGLTAAGAGEIAGRITVYASDCSWLGDGAFRGGRIGVTVSAEGAVTIDEDPTGPGAIDPLEFTGRLERKC